MFPSRYGNRSLYYRITARLSKHPKENDTEWKNPYGATYEQVYKSDNMKKQLAITKGFDYNIVWSDENLNEFIEMMKGKINEKRSINLQTIT
jgi:hypothetical protein